MILFVYSWMVSLHLHQTNWINMKKTKQGKAIKGQKTRFKKLSQPST